MAKLFNLDEKFIRRQCEEEDVPRVQNGPQFPDRDIFELALEGANEVLNNEASVSFFRETFGQGAGYR